MPRRDHPWKYLAWLACSAALIAACAAGRRVPFADPSDLARGAGRYPDLTAAQLAEGRTLYTDRCGSCHLPKAPTSQPPGTWPGDIAEMKMRARLSDRQAALVERYVVTLSLRATAQPVAAAP